MSSNKIVAIVDPYSSGSQLAREAKLRGHAILMVQSEEQVPTMYRSSFCSEEFAAIIRHQGDLEKTSNQLRTNNVDCVIAGCEMGVELSDSLSQRLGLASNGTRLSRSRRNKRLMGEALRERGVRTPSEFSSSNVDDIRAWVRQFDRWPVVLKPLCSSGSDGVSRCADEAEMLFALNNIMNRTDVFGSANDAVLVQEYLTGTQYAVDTVSYAGRHKVAAFWQYGKPAEWESFFGNDTLELLPFSQSLQRRLFPYVASVLDALEIKYGPAHCEVLLTDDGPLIVEIGARLNGGNNPMFSRYCGGKSQIDLTLDAYLDPNHFLGQLAENYTLSKGAMRVFLTPRQQGRLKSLSGLEQIERLESLHEMYVSAKVGRPLSRIAGWVVLVHDDRAVIHRDLQQIRRLEMSGLYQVEPEI